MPSLSPSDRRFIDQQKAKLPVPAKPKPFIEEPSEADLLKFAYEFLHRVTKISREDFAAAFKQGGMELISRMYDDAAADSVPVPED